MQLTLFGQIWTYVKSVISNFYFYPVRLMNWFNYWPVDVFIWLYVCNSNADLNSNLKLRLQITFFRVQHENELFNKYHNRPTMNSIVRFKDVDFSLVLESVDALCSGGWVRAGIFYIDEGPDFINMLRSRTNTWKW